MARKADGMKPAPKDAWEQDAFTGWRKFYHWKPGQIKSIKRRAHKRYRRDAKTQARDYER